MEVDNVANVRAPKSFESASVASIPTMTSAHSIGLLIVLKAAVERKVVSEPTSLAPEGFHDHVI